MSQLDLFAPEAPAAPEAPPWPVPHEGQVHLLKSVTNDKGTREALTKCGAIVPKTKSADRTVGVVAWDSLVTCPACKYHPPQPQ